MNLSKRFVAFLALSTTLSSAKMTIEPSELDDSGLIEATIRILKSCYKNRVTPVGLAGNSTALIIRKLSHEKSPPIPMINVASTAKIPVNPQSRYKLQIFMITASSSKTLTSVLSEMKASIWWNHLADFLILDSPPARQDCQNAFEILWTAWKTNVLNAKYFCYHRTKGRLIYTYNPYKNQAPDTWQLDKTHSGINNHPWTLFHRSYDADEAICKDLDFDKTLDLGGYEIRISMTSVGHVAIIDGAFGKMFFPAMKASTKVLPTTINGIGYVDEMGNPRGVMADVFTGSSDVGMTQRYLTSLKNLTMAYPHWQSELCTMTQYRGYKSQLSKIRGVIDGESQVGVCLVCLINILFFKYFLGQPLIVALLNALRIICDASLTKLPRNVASRIYLVSLFMLALTMHGIFQGRLASLLTKQESLPNVNTKRDLLDLGYGLYGFKTFHSYFDGPEFEGRFVELKQPSCTEHVLNDSMSACVNDKVLLFLDAAKFKLHLSNEPIALTYSAFQIRPDWPVEGRFNTIVQRCLESHQIQDMFKKATRKAYRALEFQETLNTDQRFEILTLEELSFAFAILGIGLGCSAVSFGIEVAIAKIAEKSEEKRREEEKSD